MISIPRTDRARLAPLFAENTRFRMIVEWALEGRGGDVTVDDTAAPNVALIMQHDLLLFGGNPAHPSAPELIATIPPGRYEAICELDPWIEVIRSLSPKVFRPFNRFACSHESLDANHLRTLTERVPEGFTVRRMDADLAARAGDMIDQWLLLGYDTPEDLARDELGWCALSGDRPVSAATSIGTCRRGIEIEIDTAPGFRLRGLARTVAANLILDCLERGIEPHWDAANNASAKLALSLGYALLEPYAAFELQLGTPADSL